MRFEDRADAGRRLAGKLTHLTGLPPARPCAWRCARCAARAGGSCWPVPVAPPAALAALGKDCDEAICLDSEPLLRAVGFDYCDIHQVGDTEAIDLVSRAEQQTVSRVERGAR